MKVLPLVLAATISACGQEPTQEACYAARETGVAGDASLLAQWPSDSLPLKVFLHPSFRNRCQESLAKALAFWQGHVAITDKRSSASVEMFFTDHLDACGTEENALGCTVIYKELAYPYEAGFSVSQVTDCAWQVIAHELGHALGFSHSESPSNIMYKYVDIRTTVSQAISVRELSLLYYDCE